MYHRSLYCTVEYCTVRTVHTLCRTDTLQSRYGRLVGKRWSIQVYCAYPLPGEPAYTLQEDGTDIWLIGRWTGSQLNSRCTILIQYLRLILTVLMLMRRCSIRV